jgi:hypothetical protein
MAKWWHGIIRSNTCTYIIIQILCEQVDRNSSPSRPQIDHLLSHLIRSLGWYWFTTLRKFSQLGTTTYYFISISKEMRRIGIILSTNERKYEKKKITETITIVITEHWDVGVVNRPQHWVYRYHACSPSMLFIYHDTSTFGHSSKMTKIVTSTDCMLLSTDVTTFTRSKIDGVGTNFPCYYSLVGHLRFVKAVAAEITLDSDSSGRYCFANYIFPCILTIRHYCSNGHRESADPATSTTICHPPGPDLQELVANKYFIC